MARVAGVDLPPHKRAEVGLTYIYGIGRSRAASILNEAGINLSTRVNDLNEDELSRIRAILEAQGEIEGDLLSLSLGGSGQIAKRLLIHAHGFGGQICVQSGEERRGILTQGSRAVGGEPGRVDRQAPGRRLPQHRKNRQRGRLAHLGRAQQPRPRSTRHLHRSAARPAGGVIGLGGQS